MLLGNLAQWDGFARASARVKDVDPALFPLDRVEQTVEVVEIGRVAAHAGHVPADQLDGLVQRLLSPARDENIGAFFNERWALASAMPLDPPVMTATLRSSFPMTASFQASVSDRLGTPPRTST